MSKKIILLYFGLFFFIFNSNSVSLENKILVKIENQIITSLDINNEFKYLVALNPSIKNTNLDIEYVPVLSRENENWKGAKGYVQHIVLNKQIDLSDSQVYACGSNEMIESAKNLLCCSGLEEINFFSDAFIQTN